MRTVLEDAKRSQRTNFTTSALSSEEGHVGWQQTRNAWFLEHVVGHCTCSGRFPDSRGHISYHLLIHHRTIGKVYVCDMPKAQQSALTYHSFVRACAFFFSTHTKSIRNIVRHQIKHKICLGDKHVLERVAIVYPADQPMSPLTSLMSNHILFMAPHLPGLLLFLQFS